MAGDATFTVTMPIARRLAVAPAVLAIAGEIAGEAAALTPVLTGTLAGSYSVSVGRDVGTALVTTSGPHYGKYVEYGTRKMRAFAPLGRALASAKGRYG